ncbi:hypothetical protein HELRODRAFT_170202 [Helobdella robusta]|uniref:Uncharacterized protein n=1 Tax=Helobdella robusta TaxID=6412 RepID=T1F2S2_HELRO|nr:hypothetical protein HELRODRAFT_170202 [Helobdella robusta]ESO07671.1 hypothetical protein HELRODRAFT_170202 [Helobdella robusta]
MKHLKFEALNVSEGEKQTNTGADGLRTLAYHSLETSCLCHFPPRANMLCVQNEISTRLTYASVTYYIRPNFKDYPLISIRKTQPHRQTHTYDNNNNNTRLDDIFPEIGGCRLATYDETEIPLDAILRAIFKLKPIYQTSSELPKLSVLDLSKLEESCRICAVHLSVIFALFHFVEVTKHQLKNVTAFLSTCMHILMIP